MRPLSIMLVAGEASGDTLAAELVQALRDELADRWGLPTPDLQPLRASLAPRFFGGGGERMEAAGVELELDMTPHAVFGFVDVFRRLGSFKRLMDRMVRLAVVRQPDVVVGVDYSGFNRRLAHRIRREAHRGHGPFHNWNPKLVQYVSPQVWASRPGRAWSMARDLDLVLSLFPFEKDWYAARVPQLRVEFTGHPMVDRYTGLLPPPDSPGAGRPLRAVPPVLLLPGSRPRELGQHLPILLGALRILRRDLRLEVCLVAPNEALAAAARRMAGGDTDLEISTGGLAQALADADLALASSGTVTMECALFRVPAVVIYRVSQVEWEVARRLVQVAHVAMPNLLAGERVYPELLQRAATPEAIAREARALLTDNVRRARVRQQLTEVVASLGLPGASRRAARAILDLIDHQEATAAGQ